MLSSATNTKLFSENSSWLPVKLTMAELFVKWQYMVQNFQLLMNNDSPTRTHMPNYAPFWTTIVKWIEMMHYSEILGSLVQNKPFQVFLMKVQVFIFVLCFCFNICLFIMPLTIDSLSSCHALWGPIVKNFLAFSCFLNTNYYCI